MRRALVVAAVCAVTLEAFARPAPAAFPRPAATPVTIANFGSVGEHLLRGAQPGREAYAELRARGVDCVVDLRDDPEAWAKTEATRAGLRYVNLPLDDKSTPTDEAARRFLAIVTRKLERGRTVYVHCAGGRHRTGSMIAVYRIAVDGWTADEAYREMKSYDYSSRFGHGGHKAYVFGYYRRMRFEPASVPLAFAPGMTVARASAILNPNLSDTRRRASE